MWPFKNKKTENAMEAYYYSIHLEAIQNLRELLGPPMTPDIESAIARVRSYMSCAVREHLERNLMPRLPTESPHFPKTNYTRPMPPCKPPKEGL